MGLQGAGGGGGEQLVASVTDSRRPPPNTKHRILGERLNAQALRGFRREHPVHTRRTDGSPTAE